MSKTIYLLQFNNYFNRTVKGPYSRVDDYTYHGAMIVGQITNMSLWNPNDGINTTITSTVGMTAIPDYALVEDGSTVVQRWYVMEARRLQGQQYRLTLHRDLIAEEHSLVMSNEANYVERGWCDVANSAIYNAEPLTFNQIKSRQIELGDISMTPWIVGYMAVDADFTAKTIEFKYLNNTYKITFPANLKDFGGMIDTRPYVTFFMPYGGFTWTSDDGSIVQNANISRLAAREISRAFSGSGLLMDLQLLPFCPNAARVTGYKTGKIGAPFIQILQDNEAADPTLAGYVCFSQSASASGFCYYYNSDEPAVHQYIGNIANIKEESLTQFHRLVSPNGNGVFEFTPAKLVYGNNSTYQIQYEMTPMPYQPYIKVEPMFSRMYGNNYDDPRGLICGGDFSLPQISDAWSTYQINNKNYQVMFNRQIESLDKQQIIGVAQDVFGAATGAIGAGFAGTMVGGGAGAIAMGTGALIGGAADIATNAILRADQREAMIQQHNWQLDNIKAMPYGVSKATNFNSEQPKLVYIEFYECSQNELDNLRKYLSLRSYNISRYGAFADYVNPTGRTWLQGIPLRLEGLTDDAHYAAALADELKQGFYVGEGTTTTNGGTN